MSEAVPSIPLSIGKDDVERVMQASAALKKSLADYQEASNNPAADDQEKKPAAKPPLHQMLLEAAKQCQNPVIQSFLEHMKDAGATETETRAGILLFHEMDKTSKLKLVFQVLSSSNETDKAALRVDQTGILSLFRAVIMSISSCIHHQKDIKLEKPAQEGQPPSKATRLEDSSSPSKTQGDDELPGLQPCGTVSFDSSLGTSKSEDEEKEGPHKSLNQEIKEIAVYAADRVIQFVRDKKNSKAEEQLLVTFDDFGEWYNSGGCAVVPWLELLHLSKWKPPPSPAPAASASGAEHHTPSRKTRMDSQEATLQSSPSLSFDASTPSLFGIEDDGSRNVISFTFPESEPHCGASKRAPFGINVSEDNLRVLQRLVTRTVFSTRSPVEVCRILLRNAIKRDYHGQSIYVLHKDDFGECIRQLVPPDTSRNFSNLEMQNFSACFHGIFNCFLTQEAPLRTDEVNAKELAVAFCFLCAGNKSSKLATGFELMAHDRSCLLTHDRLVRFLRSYLTMLVAMSLLPSPTATTSRQLSTERRRDMYAAVEKGAKLTVGHFLKSLGQRDPNSPVDGTFSFEMFANWYTSGGYNDARWLELLDLKKLLSLIGTQSPSHPYLNSARGSHRKRAAAMERSPFRHASHHAAEVLFTFPLANHRSLVVLKEDATYVRGVVEELGLLSMSPEEVWGSLSGRDRKRTRGGKAKKTSGIDKTLDKATFVKCMEEIVLSSSGSRKRPHAGSAHKNLASIREVLANFFQSFDLKQINSVPLNELMGGLTLLCGGKKSTKLAFAIGVFDERNVTKSKRNRAKPQATHSLNGENLYLFLRSFLIVMFSCCRQSLDLSDSAVGRYIADTVGMITDGVMRYQWHHKKRDRVDFDDFGEWYNEGGFETAPWLELLDLNKWVLLNDFNALGSQSSATAAASSASIMRNPSMTSNPSLLSAPSQDFDCPPAPPDDAVDTSFFTDDDNGIMQMDSMDEMDMILMQQPSQDKENDVLKNATSFSYSPETTTKQSNARAPSSNALKFHLVTSDGHGGYMLSVSQKRIRHLRQVLTESGLYKMDAEAACKSILKKASRSKSGRDSSLLLTKGGYDSALHGIVSTAQVSSETQRVLSELLSSIFSAFDRQKTGVTNAAEVACGFIVLCHGKKSDKLEFAFEVLDRNNTGQLSRTDLAHYLRSFLTVLLSMVSTPSLESDPVDDSMSTMDGTRCETSAVNLARAVEHSSMWAATQAFNSGLKGRNNSDSISFDDFAAWYTKTGYSSIPWLELLDLHKWVVVEPEGL